MRIFSLVPRAMAAFLCAWTPADGSAETLQIEEIEQTYQRVQSLRDDINTLRAQSGPTGTDGAKIPELLARYAGSRQQLMLELRGTDAANLNADDQRVVGVMRRATENQLDAEPDENIIARGTDSSGKPQECDYNPAMLARSGMDALSERMYHCFGIAAGSLFVDGEKLDRLTVLTRLAIVEQPKQRRALFLALDPVWKSVNGDGGEQSPWRMLIELSATRFKNNGSSTEASAALLGINPAVVESWLLSVLAAWRDTNAGADLEPWDFAHAGGAMDRALAPHLPLALLRPLNDRVYRELGADPVQLGVEYDLAPRAGKDPVAYTDFAARPWRESVAAWKRGRFRVSASYTGGGSGNLAELLHETGHAIHIAAIRTRPAYTDWPDSDTFTEALADLVALDLYDSDWQQRYLGMVVTAVDARRAKYSGIILDTAWALFEIRMLRNPELDPNAVWTELTREYLHIRPHPEWSWWAVRGQLVHRPGSMLNYALGAILVADLRARTRELFGARPWGDNTWYARVSERLFRFGLERPSRQVIEDYLGRPISPAALLRNLRGRGPVF